MSEPRAVVIGYGYAGRSFHAYLIDITPGLTLHGVSSRNLATREQIERELRCRAYDGLEAVLADPDVDLVVLATPNDLHAEYAIRALRAGKHVVTDKPMCLMLAECDRMIAVAEETGKLLSVFQNRRWDGDFLTVQQLMAEQRLGDVRWIEMAWQHWGAPVRWRGEAAKGGGRFYDLGAHLLDQLLLLVPHPVEAVYCRLHHDFPNRDVESHALITVHFANGATGVCDLSSMAAIPKPRFHLFGDQATFIKYGVDPQEEAMKAGHIDAAREDPAMCGRLNDGTGDRTVPTIPGRWRSYYENIRDVLTNDAELAVKPGEVRRVMALFDAALRSARTSSVVQTRI
jgi:scyllo-inositol 2-dehydrogenase (NADP+)